MKKYLPLIAALSLLGCTAQPETADSIVARISPPVFATDTFRVTDFGALPDGRSGCKPAFDKAIAACAQSGGGVVYVPAGTYFMNGPIHLVSNLNLHLQQGARLVFSGTPAHYLPVVKTSWEGTFLQNYSPFIYGYGLQNVAITGPGVIDGEASQSFAPWAAQQKNDQLLSREMNHKGLPIAERVFGQGHYLRPQLVQLYGCQNILVEDVRLEDSPFWCLHLLECRNATIRGISFAAYNKNNDGIDPEYSQDVLIENITFDNADDNVAIKAGRDHEGRAAVQGSRNIVVRNCLFRGLHALVI
ncbi:MAG: glycoside hydrolase family 28 protein, partial [Prevotellaceae bacterium]|nr:glycoside hydrolase family 28 protein [Prevotellaceae bacterium]